MRIEHVLKKIYYDPAHAASYGSLKNLYRAAKQINKKITQKSVENWLLSQEVYTRHKRRLLKFPRRKTIAGYRNHIWQSDLIIFNSLRKENNRNGYVLVCIDVFSRFMHAVPIKNKNSESVVAGFKKIFKSGEKPLKLQTDKDKAYLSKYAKAFFDKHDIILYQTQQDTKASIVERSIRTLKDRLFRYFTANNTLNYTRILQQLVNAYNQKIHRSIGIAPINVNKKNRKRVFDHQYGQYLKNSNPIKYKYHINDKVRLSKYRETFTKGYKPAWTNEIFYVTDRKATKPPTYVLRDSEDQIIDGAFYEPELGLVKTN